MNDDWPAWTRSVDKAADEEAGRWAKAEALALYALDEALREAGLDDQPDLAETLVREAFFRGHREPETLVADVQARAAALVAERKQEGESCERRLARVALALKEACDARNLRPSLIAADALRKKILKAWRNGQDLQEAAAAAARQYENSDRNDAVPQTVWDPSGNRTAQASAMVKFMPFRSASQCHAIGDDAFSYVYTFLHFSLLGTVALCASGGAPPRRTRSGCRTSCAMRGGGPVSRVWSRTRRSRLYSTSPSRGVLRKSCAATRRPSPSVMMGPCTTGGSGGSRTSSARSSRLRES